MDSQSNPLLSLFHHIHHTPNGHVVHHCGGKHKQIDPTLTYTIRHCGCGLHDIDVCEALGHTTDEHAQLVVIKIRFTETCPEGGWHIESGVVMK